jgi:hypothetical protein
MLSRPRGHTWQTHDRGADDTASSYRRPASSDEEVRMATKDKNAKKAQAKKPAQKSLKEKRQAKKDKK